MTDLSDIFVDQIKTASTDKKMLTIVGNGTKTSLGRRVEHDAITLSTVKHTGITSYEPVELVMTARAGTTLAEIDAELAKHNQYLACDPARFDGQATIGGSLAANQAGPSRPWLGSLRDHVLGVNLINGKGEHLRFGGQVMKNVAGYDVSRLQAGAMGTLGLMTDISFKVLPCPAAAITLTQDIDADDAIYLMNQLAGQAKPLTAACWIEGILYLQLSGAKSAVESTVDVWVGDIMPDQEAVMFWNGLRDHKHHFFSQRSAEQALWRFSINSTAAPFLKDEQWLFDWGGSLRWLKGDFAHAELQQWAAEQGGEVILYQGGDRSKDIYYQPHSVMKKIQKELKQSFDPHNIFNLGRLYSWM
ncbi:MAG: glycolate oxidase subunit GlcE [Cellvibrionaceae bacterium]